MTFVSMIFQLYFGTVPTMLYTLFFISFSYIFQDNFNKYTNTDIIKIRTKRAE
jgi:hypothetical protein